MLGSVKHIVSNVAATTRRSVLVPMVIIRAIFCMAVRVGVLIRCRKFSLKTLVITIVVTSKFVLICWFTSVCEFIDSIIPSMINYRNAHFTSKCRD